VNILDELLPEVGSIYVMDRSCLDFEENPDFMGVHRWLLPKQIY